MCICIYFYKCNIHLDPSFEVFQGQTRLLVFLANPIVSLATLLIMSFDPLLIAASAHFRRDALILPASCTMSPICVTSRLTLVLKPVSNPSLRAVANTRHHRHCSFRTTYTHNGKNSPILTSLLKLFSAKFLSKHF